MTFIRGRFKDYKQRFQDVLIWDKNDWPSSDAKVSAGEWVEVGDVANFAEGTIEHDILRLSGSGIEGGIYLPNGVPVYPYFSMSFIFKSHGATKTLYDQSSSGSNEKLQVKVTDSNKLLVHIIDSNLIEYNKFSNILSADEWHHIVLVQGGVNREKIYLYIDNVLEVYFTITANTFFPPKCTIVMDMNGSNSPAVFIRDIKLSTFSPGDNLADIIESEYNADPYSQFENENLKDALAWWLPCWEEKNVKHAGSAGTNMVLYNYANMIEGTLIAPGYELEYNAGLTETVKGGIIETSAKFAFKQDDIFSDVLDILTQQEECTLLVEIKDAFRTIYRGVLLQNFSGYDDSPYKILEFESTDGLAFLKDIESSDLTSQGYTRTFGELITKALETLPSYDLWLTDQTLAAFRTKWFTSNMNDSAEPLFQVAAASVLSLKAQTKTKSTYDGQQYVELEYLSWYDVVQEIMKAFNAVILQAYGNWWIMQRDLGVDVSSYNTSFHFHAYKKNNGYQTSPLIQKTLFAIDPENYPGNYDMYSGMGYRYFRSNGKFSLLPAIYKAQKDWTLVGLAQLVDEELYTLGTIKSTSPVSGNVAGTNYIEIIINADDALQAIAPNPEDLFLDMRKYYYLRVDIGSSYSLNEDGEWIPYVSSGYWIDMLSANILEEAPDAEDDEEPYYGIVAPVAHLQFTLNSNPIPSDVSNEEIEFELRGGEATDSKYVVIGTSDEPPYDSFGPDDWYESAGGDPGQLQGTIKMEYFVEDETAPDYVRFENVNDNINNGRKVRFPQARWGSAGFNNNSSLVTFNDVGATPFPYNSQNWYLLNESAQADFFNKLYLQRMIHDHYYPLYTYSGDIICKGKRLTALEFIVLYWLDSTAKEMAVNRLQFNCQTGIYQVDLIQFRKQYQLTLPESSEEDVGIEFYSTGEAGNTGNSGTTPSGYVRHDGVYQNTVAQFNTHGGGIDTDDGDVDAGIGLITGINSKMTAFKAIAESEIIFANTNWNDIEFETKSSDESKSGCTFLNEGESLEDTSIIVISEFNDIVSLKFTTTVEASREGDENILLRILASTDEGSTWSEIKGAITENSTTWQAGQRAFLTIFGMKKIDGEMYIKVQAKVSNTDLSLKKNTGFDNPIAAEINIINIGDNRSVT